MWFRGAQSLSTLESKQDYKDKSQTLNPLVAKPAVTSGRAKSSNLSSSAKNGLRGRRLVAAIGRMGNLTSRGLTLIHRAHGGVAGLLWGVMLLLLPIVS